MHRKVTEVHFRFHVIQRPYAHIARFPLMAGISSHRRVTLIDRAPRPVLNGADESAAAPRGESSIPFIRQQQFELYVSADCSFYFKMGSGIWILLLIRTHRYN